MAPLNVLTRLPTRVCPRAALSLRSRHEAKRYASTAAAIAPASGFEDAALYAAPIQRYPPKQPPSYKPAHERKTQLHRLYTSMLRTTPLMLVFQHNNLRAGEWAGIRRELAHALRRASAQQAQEAGTTVDDMAERVKFKVITPSIFASALRIIEFFKPDQGELLAQTEGVHASEQHDATPKHALSKEAHEAGVRRVKVQGQWVKIPKKTSLDALLSGPIAILSFPEVTPQHLAAALSILAPTQGASSEFPAPKRKDQPGLFEPSVQVGLQKLILLGARIEGQAMDQQGVKFVGGIKGGLNSLRAQLVYTLQSAGMGLTRALEGASNALWVTMESRRLDMESGAGEAITDGGKTAEAANTTAETKTEENKA